MNLIKCLKWHHFSYIMTVIYHNKGQIEGIQRKISACASRIRQHSSLWEWKSFFYLYISCCFCAPGCRPIAVIVDNSPCDWRSSNQPAYPTGSTKEPTIHLKMLSRALHCAWLSVLVIEYKAIIHKILYPFQSQDAVWKDYSRLKHHSTSTKHGYNHSLKVSCCTRLWPIPLVT